MSTALEIAVSEAAGDVPVAVMRVSGDLDSKSHSQLETKAGDLITAGKSRIVLDLSAITFMGSAGLRAMHGIANRLKTAGGGGQLKLVKPSDAAARVMKTLGFDQFFEIHASVDEALASFRRR
ncbi:MAG: STAS domain-containing protein [Rubrivivax sp.]|nr:STAS domain-containing protein [Rubrivivax sp.]